MQIYVYLKYPTPRSISNDFIFQLPLCLFGCGGKNCRSIGDFLPNRSTRLLLCFAVLPGTGITNVCSKIFFIMQVTSTVGIRVIIEFGLFFGNTFQWRIVICQRCAALHAGPLEGDRCLVRSRRKTARK